MNLSKIKYITLPVRFLLILFILMTNTIVNAQQLGTEYTPKYEIRAVWLTTLGRLDWPSRPTNFDISAVNKQKKELISILDKLKAVNINTVLLQTRIRATVIYPSAIEPWDECFTGTYGRSPGYDPLAFAIDECHKRGMELHAWVVVMPVGNWNSYGCRALRKKNSKILMHKDGQGYMNPANPSVASYIASICKEITTNYDIDGIHLDYIRYPEAYRNSVNRYNERITAIVRSVRTAINSVKPWVKLSCAAIGKYSDLPRKSSNGWSAINTGRQDAQEWLHNGLIDQIYPMIYFRNNDFMPFALDWSENIYNGAMAGGLAAYMLSGHKNNWSLLEIERQMNVLRYVNSGFAFFRTRYLINNVKGLYSFTESFCPYPALVPPTKRGYNDKVPPPTDLKVKYLNDYIGLTWSLPVYQPDGGLTFNVYASADSHIDIKDPRNLIINNLRDNYITINRNSKLNFAVTSVDRYGNESKPVIFYNNTSVAIKNKYLLSNDGYKLLIPKDLQKTANGYVAFKSLAGMIVGIGKYEKNGEIDVRKLNPGCYSIHSISKDGNAHRIGFTIIK